MTYWPLEDGWNLFHPTSLHVGWTCLHVGCVQAGPRSITQCGDHLDLEEEPQDEKHVCCPGSISEERNKETSLIYCLLLLYAIVRGGFWVLQKMHLNFEQISWDGFLVKATSESTQSKTVWACLGHVTAMLGHRRRVTSRSPSLPVVPVVHVWSISSP